ncbi:MAG TPA: alpha/beta fold hydrolase [Dictyobacter sp.]|jgi:alpha-beta hydrolase superfamily lysophospholipase|nr:alpha/beta fold hydrolase [Dictyobacter sp.]
MSGSHRRTIGIATSTVGILGLTLTGGLAVVSQYFVEEFSRPHVIVPGIELTLSLPYVSPGEPELAFQRTILFQATDGTLLSGEFWAQPQPAPTIIVCHGYRISRMHLRPVAELAYARGYNVFFFDFRGHGESDSVMTSAGNAEVRDMEAALYVAAHQPETLPGKIIIHGFSMGASIALLTPPHPDIVAIIADSPYARSDDILRRLIALRLHQEWIRRYPRYQLSPSVLSGLAWSIVSMSAFVFRLRYGYPVVARPDTSFKRWKQRSRVLLQHRSIPILLIHSAEDSLIPFEHARQLSAEAKAQGVPLETYFVASGAHCGAYSSDPVQYEQVLYTFLARHLKDDLPVQHRFV